jgi:hypothetical protein
MLPLTTPEPDHDPGLGELDAVDPRPGDLQDAVECRADAHVCGLPSLDGSRKPVEARRAIPHVRVFR